MLTSSPLPRLAVAQGVWGKTQSKGSIWATGNGKTDAKADRGGRES